MKYLIAILSFLFVSAAQAEMTIAIWNIDGTHFSDRADQYKQFKAEANPDIIILNELLSHKMNAEFLSQAGFSGWSAVTSEFSKDSETKSYYKLEVGIASHYQISNMIEYDPRPDNDDDENDLPIIIPSYIPDSQRRIKSYRGFILTEIPEKKLAIVAMHLKSSGGKTGKKDEKNSQKREIIIGAAIEAVASHKRSHTGWSYIVAGDFNVSPGDTKKTGYDFNAKCIQNDCSGYDQTHAIASGAYTDGISMTNVVAFAGRSYAKGNYANSPIDNIYVTGSLFDGEYTVRKHGPYGSDHYVLSVMFK